MFIESKCPNCGALGCAYITQISVGSRIRQVVFDACNHCGTKTTEYQEFEREKTPQELAVSRMKSYKSKQQSTSRNND